MPRLTGAQAIIASLEAEGVECVFGYPGAQAVTIFDALYDSKIRFVLARHEQAAVHEADGYARASGKAGVVLVTSGPGAANTVTGIATAYMDSTPLVVITAQVPTTAIGTDSFQESDIFGITLPVVKHSYLMRDAADLPTTIKEAFHIATTGRPGPVLIDVPSDVSAAEFEFAYPDAVDIASYKPTVRGNQKQVRQAASLIAAAKQPVLLVGGGVIAAQADTELAALAQYMHIPVACTMMGKGAFPSNDALNLGAVGMHGSKYAGLALHEADVLVAVGTRFSDRVTGNPQDFAPNARLIHIDIDPAEIGKILPAATPIVGDAKGVLEDILASLKKRDAKPQTDRWLKQIEAWKSEHPLPEENAATNNTIQSRTLLAALSDLLGKEKVPTIVTTDVGQHQMWANQAIARNTPRSFITSGGLGTMGFGLPAALGASLAQPKAQVVCITGDGSFQMNMQEMATITELGLPIKVLLLNNDGLGMVRQWQDLFYNKRYSATEFAYNPNFCALAGAYGWDTQRIEQAKEIPDALQHMLEATGPTLLEVAIPPSQLVYPMVPPGASASEGIESAEEAEQLLSAKKGGRS